MSSAPVLSILARLLLRVLLPRWERERAHDDLRELHRRVFSQHGAPASKRACEREALFIVGWSLLERARAVLDWRAAIERIRRAGMLNDFGQDLRLSARALARRPGFSVIAVGVLALIGFMTPK